jgi:protein-disulfide isomerase
VKIYDLREKGMKKAKEYGINSVPTVVVNGEDFGLLQAEKNNKDSPQDSWYRNSTLRRDRL